MRAAFRVGATFFQSRDDTLLILKWWEHTLFLTLCELRGLHEMINMLLLAHRPKYVAAKGSLGHIQG